MDAKTKAQAATGMLNDLGADVNKRVATAKSQAAAKKRLNQVKPRIRLNIGGQYFSTSKSTLLKFPITLFSVMLSTNLWEPGEDGVYFFDHNPCGFHHILDFLSEGSINLDILTPVELKNLKADLDYFHIPFILDEKEQRIRARTYEDVQAAKDALEPKRLEKAVGSIYEVKDAEKSGYQLLGLTINRDHPQQALIAQALETLDYLLSFDASITRETEDLVYNMTRWRQLEALIRDLAKSAKQQIKLDFRGKLFTTTRATLMESPWFEAQVSRWQPEPDTGAYFIDRNPRFIDLILDFLRDGVWKLDGFDKRLIPALYADLDYFNVTPQFLTVCCSWDPNFKTQLIVLSQDDQIATCPYAPSTWQIALGRYPVRCITFVIKNRASSESCYVGLAPSNKSLSGGTYGAGGYFLDLGNGNTVSQHGPIRATFGQALAVNDCLEFKYDRDEQTISVRYGAEAELVPLWINVTGWLYPCLEVKSGTHSIEIAQVKI